MAVEAFYNQSQVQEYQQSPLFKRIRDRQENLQGKREPREDRMADIIDFVDPGLTSFDEGNENKFRGTKIFEGTPPWGLRTMADGWQGNMLSESLEWLHYTHKDLKGVDEFNSWARSLEEQMYYNYRESELYQAIGPFIRGGLSVGSPVIIPYEDTRTRKDRCIVPHPRENFHGPMGNYHRKYPITAGEAVRQFMDKPPTDALQGPLSAALLSDYLAGRHYESHTFIMAIYRKDDPILDGIELAAKLRNKEWVQFYIEWDADDMTGKILKEDGYFTKPHIRWDYEINTDEFYSRTPSWHAIQDIRSGQELAKQRLEVGQHMLNPPMWMMAKHRMGYSHLPRAINTYDNPDEVNNIPRPVQDGVRYDVGVDVHEMTKKSVERWYHTDLWMVLTQMTSENRGEWPTATQVMEVQGEKAMLVAPRVGTFTNVMRQIDDRFVDMADRRGQLPDPPPIVQEYIALRGSLRLVAEFIGPLAQIQKKYLGLRRIQAGLELTSAYMNLDENLKHKVRLSKSLERALEESGFNQDDIVPEDEYQEYLAEVAEQERQMAMAQLASDAIPKMGHEIEKDSPADLMMGVKE